MTRCSHCKETKPNHLFSKDKSKKNGLDNQCKSCRSIFWDSESKRAFLRAKSKRLGLNKYNRRKEWLTRYAIVNKNAVSARNAVRLAVKLGSLKKLSCQVCNEPKSHAHHHAGYNKENWLVVTWLCQEHHRQAHAK